jgi:hypothetical protein
MTIFEIRLIGTFDYGEPPRHRGYVLAYSREAAKELAGDVWPHDRYEEICPRELSYEEVRALPSDCFVVRTHSRFLGIIGVSTVEDTLYV